MSPKKAPAKAAPKKVVKKPETLVVTEELLKLNPTWSDEEIVVGDEIEAPEDAVLEAPAAPPAEEAAAEEAPAEEAPAEPAEEEAPAEEAAPATEEETTKKEVVVSKQGNKTEKKDTIKKSKANQKEAEKLSAPLGGRKAYEIVTNLKRNGTEHQIGDKVNFEDSLGVQRLVESGCIKKI